MIRDYLIAKDASLFNSRATEQREQDLRQSAERKVKVKLGQSRRWLPRQWLFNWVLQNARLGVRNRENMRFARTRIYGILRRMLRSLGQQLADQELQAAQPKICSHVVAVLA